MLKPKQYRPNLRLIDHPLAAHKLSYMRDKLCSTNRFRELAREMGIFLAYNIMDDQLTTMRKGMVDTDIEEAEAWIMADKPVLVPLVRGGLVLAEGALSIIIAAHVGHIGLEHRETDHTVEDKLVVLPQPRDRPFILMDMAVATGNMACRSIELLEEKGVQRKNISFATILIAPEGLEKLWRAFPEVKVYAFAVEKKINKKNRVVPGFGNSEERLFGPLGDAVSD